MIFGIIKWVIISLILILLIHHLFFFFKNTLTVPIVKDLVHQPSQLYKEIEKTLNDTNTIKLSSINNTNNVNNTTEMKDELKNFFNELNHNKQTSFQEINNKFSNNMYSEL
jgi:hypothetical protein